MVDVRFSQAAGAYQDAFKAAQNIISKVSAGDTSPTSETSQAKGSSFFDLVSNALSGAAQSGYTSEATTTANLAGKAGIADVVNAVNSAETALNTVVAVRDKMISAYSDIIKMQI